MDIDLPHRPPHGSTYRSSNGCWTCRLRRKKCDENRPVCDACAALLITCHYAQDKPDWMDGGARQEEMAERLKREVKEKAHRRPRGERAAHSSGDRASVNGAAASESMVLAPRSPMDLVSPRCSLVKTVPDLHSDRADPCSEASTLRLQRGADCTLTHKDSGGSPLFGRSDTVLFTFYLEHVFPFLFPFYRPSPLQGGKSWILEMMMSSPVVRQATLCQSSYFFSLAAGTANWETVLAQTRDAFEVLRQALQVITTSNITEHLHGAVRIMASIMQVQRFEIAISTLENWHAHHNAALALFKQLLDSACVVEPACPRLRFDDVMSRLGPSTRIFPTQCVQLPSAEQAAFRFSSALLILDDIIASTVLQEQPRLYDYHHILLGTDDDTNPSIDLEAVVGCQNWAFLHVGEIAALDAWKQQCKRAGNLDVMELVHRATTIKASLEAHLARLETAPLMVPKGDSSLLDILTADHYQRPGTSANQHALLTRAWAHAAFLYLSVVVSGWQPASVDVRCNVSRIIELLTRQISPPALLRTLAWPFCVAGCLAAPAEEAQLRAMVEALQPPSVFGIVRRALETMENVWRSRNTEDAASRDLAMCFRSQGDMVLLI